MGSGGQRAQYQIVAAVTATGEDGTRKPRLTATGTFQIHDMWNPNGRSFGKTERPLRPWTANPMDPVTLSTGDLFLNS